MRAITEFSLCVFLITNAVVSGKESIVPIEKFPARPHASLEDQEFLFSVLEQILSEYGRVRQEVTLLRTSQAELQAQQGESAKQITELEQQNLVLKQALSNLQKQVEGGKTYYEDERLEQNQTSKRLVMNSEVGLPMTPQIAFSARVLNNVQNLYKFQIFVFDYTVTNSGNGYNKNDGLFVAPVKGVYVFFATVVTLPGKALESQIVRNGNNIGNIFTADVSSYGSGSNMAVTDLELGDAVWVRVLGMTQDHGTGPTVDGGFTTFSGFLLFETFM